MFFKWGNTISVFQLLAKIPFLSDVLAMCVTIPMQDVNKSLSKLVGMASSLQDLFFHWHDFFLDFFDFEGCKLV